MYRDSRWQQKRLEVMERDGWKCRSCGASGDGVTLNVHHAYYETGKKPWEYPSTSLFTWCEECHSRRHKMNGMLQTCIARLQIQQVSGLFTLLYVYDAGQLFSLFEDAEYVDMSAIVTFVTAKVSAYEDVVNDDILETEKNNG